MHSTNETPVVTEPVTEFACSSCGMVSDLSELKPFSDYLCPGCSAELTVPARFGNFLLLKLLGSGGMGSVFMAQDETLGRKVALKVMLKSLGDNAQFVETFKREAQAAAKLNHPHIAQIYAFGQVSGQPYIVMELVSGKNLDDLIDSGARISPAFVVKIGADLAAGLKLAADIGLVHGDIKPENILLNESHHAKLVDFGIAGMTNQQSDEIWGTPYYIAPEKVRRQRIDHRADIYSLGATLYHAIAGQPPFKGETALDVVKARFHTTPEPLTSIRSDVDPQIVQMIDRMLQLEPAMRYPTYESLLGDMRRYLDSVGDVSRLAPIEGTRRLLIRKKGSAGQSSGALSGTDAGNAAATNGRGLVVSRGQFGDTGSYFRSDESPPASEESVPVEGSRRRFPRWMAVTVGALLIVALAGLGGWLLWRRAVLDDPDLLPPAPSPETVVDASPEEPEADPGATDEAVHAQAREVLDRVEAYAGAARERMDAAAAAVSQALAGDNPDLEDESVSEQRQSIHGAHAQLRESCAVVIQAAEKADLAYRILIGEIVAPAEAATVEVPVVTETGPDTVVTQDDRDVSEPSVDAATGEPSEPATADADPAETATDEGELQDAPPVEPSAEPVDAEAPEPAAEADAVESETAGAAPRIQGELSEIRSFAEEAELMMGVSERQWDALQSLLARYVEIRARVAEGIMESRQRARAESERRARIDTDLVRVRGSESELAVTIRRRLYRDARWALRDLAEDMETDQGRAAAERLRRRLERIIALHEFLAEESGKKVMPRIWIEGALTYDVTAADAVGVTVQGQVIPWTELDSDDRVANLVRILQHLLLDDQRSQSIRLRQRVDQMVNAAVYLLVYGQGSPHAETLARKFADRAVQQFPAIRETLEDVVPELVAPAP